MNTDTHIPLPRLSGELRRLTGQHATYRFLSEAVRDGMIPTEMEGRLHYVRRDELPAIAKTLRLVPADKQPVAA